MLLRLMNPFDKVMAMWCLSGVLFAILICTISSIIRGPDNRAGIHHENMSLGCDSDVGEQVTWTFTQFGHSADVKESDIPGYHGSWRSADGHHSLALRGLTFQNAGKYECRKVGFSGGGSDFDAKIAYVVVIADPPRCTTDSVFMECSVTFFGELNLTLEWLAANGNVLARRVYQAGEVPNVARLGIGVEASSRYSGPITCHVSFDNWTSEFDDEATNSPQLRHNTCTVPLPSSTTDEPAYPQSLASEPGLIAAVCVLAAALIIVIVLLVIVACRVYRGKVSLGQGRGHGRIEDGLSDGRENNSNSAQYNIQNENGAAGDSETLSLLINRQGNSKPDVSKTSTSSEQVQVDGSLNSVTAAQLETETEQAMGKLSEDLAEPEANGTPVQERANDIGEMDQEDSAIRSADCSVDDAAGHNETDRYREVDLTAAAAGCEPEDEDQVDSGL